MRIFAVLFTFLTIFAACSSSENSSANTNDKKVTVTEVIHTTEYTYLKVKENDKEFWMAVPKMDAKVGDEYYYAGGFEMVNFQSKELNRTFESVLFLEGVSKEPIKENQIANNPHNMDTNTNHEGHNHDQSNVVQEGQKPKIEKSDVKVAPVSGGITIAELFGNKDKYSEKTVKIKAKVVKANYGIMNTNWYHIQDGTEKDGKFDLTVTSPNADIKVGQEIVFEGKIVLNKDFGYGYFYDILLENAVGK